MRKQDIIACVLGVVLMLCIQVSAMATDGTNAVLFCHDSRLAPFCAKLAQLTTNSTPKDIETLFGPSEPVPRFISAAFESVHSLNDGGTLRIKAWPEDGGRWRTSATYIVPRGEGRATNVLHISGAQVMLNQKGSNRTSEPSAAPAPQVQR